MVDDHTVEDCTKDVGTLDDENFRHFRFSPTFPKESRMCYGCWVPGNVRACLRLLISTEVSRPDLFCKQCRFTDKVGSPGENGLQVRS